MLDHSDLWKGQRLPETLTPGIGKTEALFYFFASLNIIKRYIDTSFFNPFCCFSTENSSDLALEQVGNDPLNNILVVPIISGRTGSTHRFSDEPMGGLSTLLLLFL